MTLLVRFVRFSLLPTVLGLGLALTAAAADGPRKVIAPAAQLDAAQHAEQLVRGAYLANAGDCIACHTAKGGKPLAGGLSIDTPYGAMPSPNITPDKATGIGAWTSDQFYRVMHEGIGRHGEYLYPVMPFPWYTSVTRRDVDAIFAWLQTQPAVNQANQANKLRFPYGIRNSLLAWRVAFFKAKTFEPDPAQSAEVNRGAYLANGLGHCGECHNGRPVAGASKWRESLKGGTVANWYAPNITSDVRDGIGGWTNAQIAQYLKTGNAPGKTVALGPMAEAVHSLAHMTDADLLAMAAYLKSTPPQQDAATGKKDLYAGPGGRGADAYLDHCASCHGADGKGLAGVIPPLDGNGLITAGGPQNVISVVVGGLQARAGYAPMPAVGAGMRDEEVAEVVNYVRQSWGNAAPATAEAGMVAKLRGSTSTLMNGAPQQNSCPTIPTPALARALGLPVASASIGSTGVAGQAIGSQTATPTSTKLQAELAAVTDANLPDRIGPLVQHARAAAPGVPQAGLVNGLTAAYCTALRADPALNANQRALRLGQFSQLAYMAASGHAVR